MRRVNVNVATMISTAVDVPIGRGRHRSSSCAVGDTALVLGPTLHLALALGDGGGCGGPCLGAVVTGTAHETQPLCRGAARLAEEEAGDR